MFGLRETKKACEAVEMFRQGDDHYADGMNDVWLFREEGNPDRWNVSVRHMDKHKAHLRNGDNIIARNLILDKAMMLAKAVVMIEAANRLIDQCASD